MTPAFDIARQRLYNQHLAGNPLATPAAVVHSLGAVQSQDYANAIWGVGQRVKDCVAADVDRAYNSGKVLRTHVLRPTWHFVSPADIRWMLHLSAPRVNRQMSYYNKQLELDAAVFTRANTVIEKALAGGHRTRKALQTALEAAGIEGTGQRFGHILMNAELDALICSGAMRGKQHTHAWLNERVPPTQPLSRDEALATLALRYFTSHGPALPQDFAWWAGLTVADAKRAIAMQPNALQHETTDGKTFSFVPPPAAAKPIVPAIMLLPNYDEYVIAYRDHDATLDPSLPGKSAYMYDMLSRHLVIRQGRIVGGWRNPVGKTSIAIEANLALPLSPAHEKALRAAAARYAKFLGKAVTVA